MRKRNVGNLVIKALRHNPQMLNLHLDKAGYCTIDELIKNLNLLGYKVDRQTIEKVAENERFSFNKNHTKLRADYGNSIGLRLSDMYASNEMPPEILYHGTSYDAVPSIKQNGIVRFAKNGKPRDHIFLTELRDIALRKGARHGTAVVLPIKAKEMHNNGYKFYHPKNDIWLIEDAIPPEYIDFNNLLYD